LKLIKGREKPFGKDNYQSYLVQTGDFMQTVAPLFDKLFDYFHRLIP
jgi:hypothetical protein